MNRSSHKPFLFARFLRIAWGRRLESGLALVATVTRAFLVHFLGLRIGTALLGVIGALLIGWGPSRSWMLSVYRIERSERRCQKAFDSAGIEIPSTPAVTDERATRSGVAYDVCFSPRLTSEDFATLLEPLAVAFDATSVRVHRDRARARRGELVVSYRDTLAEPAIQWPWAGIDRSGLWNGVPIGYDEEDALVVLPLRGHHVLFGGEPGAGKSNALSIVVAAAALDPTVELWCFDGKLVELARWRRCARRFVGPDVEQAVSVLGELHAEMEGRYDWMLQRGLNEIDRQSGSGLIVLVVDELALYTQGKSKTHQELSEVLRDIVARGRAAGIVVVAATQKPSHDIVPTSIRDLMSCRLAFRCATRDASDTVLGVGWATAGYSASDIDASTRGVGYLLAEGTIPRRMRCYVFPNDLVEPVVRRAEQLRGVAP